MNQKEIQVLRIVDKFKKIGADGVMELLQKPYENHGANLDPLRAGMVVAFLCGNSKRFNTLKERRALVDEMIAQDQG